MLYLQLRLLKSYLKFVMNLNCIENIEAFQRFAMLSIRCYEFSENVPVSCASSSALAVFAAMTSLDTQFIQESFG